MASGLLQGVTKKDAARFRQSGEWEVHTEREPLVDAGKETRESLNL